MKNKEDREIERHKKISRGYANIRERHPNGLYYNKIWIEKMLSLTGGSFKKILDYGCGTGSIFPFLLKKYPDMKYIGIDLSPDMLKIAKRKYPNANFLIMSGEKLIFKSMEFDFCIGRGILHHLNDPIKGVSEVNRVLKPDGCFLISEPHSNLITSFLRTLAKRKTHHFDEDHKEFSEKDLKQILSSNNFETIKCSRFGFLAFPFGLPDIIKFLQYMPTALFKILVRIDMILGKIPLLNLFSWQTIILTKKMLS